MRACNPWLSFFSLVLCTAGAPGCTSTDPADADVQNGTSELAAGPGVSMTDPQACIIASSTRSAQSADGSSPTRGYIWRSYLVEQRVVRDIAVDAQGKPLAYDSTE